jgi:hypothetical protein
LSGKNRDKHDNKVCRYREFPDKNLVGREKPEWVGAGKNLLTVQQSLDFRKYPPDIRDTRCRES